MCKNYNYESADIVGNIVWGFDERELISKECFKNEYGEFEGYKFCIPEGFDQYLTQCYGNYMELPPEEERITHQFEAEWKDKYSI